MMEDVVLSRVAIIVPCKKQDEYVDRCLHYLDKMNRPDGVGITIHVISDDLVPGFPSAKRNWAMKKYADHDFFAFIDSDAYPHRDWLVNALYWLQCFDAVCGPGVLPFVAPFSERVADQVHRRVFCPYRVKEDKPRIVPWHPTFNLIVKNGVATPFEDFLTGEDDRFGVKIKNGIFYHPSILVYHNRRGAFKPLWKQFGTYARHKGRLNRLAFVAWLTALWTYAVNFVNGFLRRKQ